LDTKSLSQALLRISIDLCNRDLILSAREVLGELLVDWGEGLAVTAPWCKELYEGWLAGDGNLIEVAWNEVEDCGFVESVGRSARSCSQGDGGKASEHEALE
jgi:hypothetical protein